MIMAIEQRHRLEQQQDGYEWLMTISVAMESMSPAER